MRRVPSTYLTASPGWPQQLRRIQPGCVASGLAGRRSPRRTEGSGKLQGLLANDVTGLVCTNLILPVKE